MYKSITSLLFFLCTVFLSGLSAQKYSDFDISLYYTPDIVRNQLDVSVNAANSFYNHKATADSSVYDNFSWTVTPTFVRYRNTRSQYSFFQLSGQSTGDYSNNKYSISQSENKRLLLNNNVALTFNQKLYNRRDLFVSFGINSDYSTYLHRVQTILSGTGMNLNSINSTGNNTFNFKPKVGVGIGRMESVEDARQAVFLLEELSKKNRLAREANGNEIFRLAQHISKVKNKRFLDSRLRKIDEITAIDSFLVQNKFVGTSDARYFTTLYDIWDYGALNSRKSGQEFEIAFLPSTKVDVVTERSIDTLYWKTRNNELNKYELNLTYRYENPVHLNWQHSVEASLGFYSSVQDMKMISGLDNVDIEVKTQNKGSALSGRYGLGFYPNTRTYFSIALVQNVSVDLYKDLNDVDSEFSKILQTYSNVNLSANYYFSPQLRISGSVGAGYNFKKEVDLRYSHFSGGFNIALNYAFF